MTRLQRWCSIFLVLLALGVRVWMLDYKPAHFDEGVNGGFIDGMRDSGYYVYDPANYHGPLHFYALFTSQQLFGRSLWALRLPTVLVGTGVVVLLLAFRRFLPFRAVALAALFTAVSPAMIFYARYAIHEMWLPFFALLAAYGGIGLAHGERRRGDLWCLAMGLTGMVLTKETYIVHFVAAVLALVFIGIPIYFSRSAASRRPRPADLFNGPEEDAEPPEPATPTRPDAIQTRDVLAAWGVSFGLLVAFYSGFGFNWAGVEGMLTTFAPMQVKATDGEVAHNKEAFYWLKLMAYYEWPALAGLLAALFVALPRSIWAGALLVIGGVGLLCVDLKDHPGMGWGTTTEEITAQAIAEKMPLVMVKVAARPADFLRPNLRLTDAGVVGAAAILIGLGFFLAKPAPERAVRWLALYGLASFAAYSLIPYKTPWCSINFLWPFCLVLGCVLDRMTKTVSAPATALVTGLLLSANLHDAYRLNYGREIPNATRAVDRITPVHDALPATDPATRAEGDRYAYVQTTFDINHLLTPLDKLIAQDPRNRQITGYVFGEEPPLKWYLNDMPNVYFFSAKERLKAYDAGFLIVPETLADTVEASLSTRYYRSPYEPRGGGDACLLYLEAARFGPVLDPERVPEFIPLKPRTEERP
jgi:uncharacterized protein (TIGR03663 family)